MNDAASDRAAHTQPTIALALGAGGARGLAHIAMHTPQKGVRIRTDPAGEIGSPAEGPGVGWASYLEVAMSPRLPQLVPPVPSATTGALRTGAGPRPNPSATPTW